MPLLRQTARVLHGLLSLSPPERRQVLLLLAEYEELDAAHQRRLRADIEREVRSLGSLQQCPCCEGRP